MVPIKEFCQKQWPKDQTREQWVAALRDLDPAHVTWKVPWMNQGSVLYGCGDKMWVPLLGLWGVISYAPLLVCRQYASKQFIPATHGLDQLEFAYGDSGYAAQLAKLSTLWSEPQWVDLVRHGNNITPGYMECVITVSRSTWNDKNQMQWSRHQSFCLGVIGHRKCLSFYKN